MQEQVTLDNLVETSKQTAGVHADTYKSQIGKPDNIFFGLKGVLSIGLLFSGFANQWMRLLLGPLVLDSSLLLSKKQ